MNGIMVAVGAVVRDGEGRVLLVKHVPERKSFWEGKWICPGGRLNPGESIEEGIRREVKEETGLDIELTAQLLPFETIVKREGRLELHVIYLDYLARWTGGELRVGSDVGEARWVASGELERIWDQVHQDTKRLLKLAGIVKEEK